MHKIPYGKQTIYDDDIQAIIDVLKDNTFLTTGPKVDEFEQKVCQYTNMKYSVAVSNGTAALHCAVHCINLRENDEIIVPDISFIASANCVKYCNAIPIFCDIEPNTLNIDTNKIEKLITKKTKAILVVDFAGQLANYDVINKIAKKHNLYVIEDAAHSLGVTKNNSADLITFSFHPVKNITTCEGGMILTNNLDFATKMKNFRNHGIDLDYKNRHLHYYSMIDLGYNYRLTDIQCALGISQLNKLDHFIKRRQEIAQIYNNYINNSFLCKHIIPLETVNDNAYHIYVIKILTKDRDEVYKKLIEQNICVNVHYKPIHLHPYYQNIKNKCIKYPLTNSEEVYKQILTLPIYPLLTNDEIDYIIKSLENIFN